MIDGKPTNAELVAALKRDADALLDVNDSPWSREVADRILTAAERIGQLSAHEHDWAWFVASDGQSAARDCSQCDEHQLFDRRKD